MQLLINILLGLLVAAWILLAINVIGDALGQTARPDPTSPSGLDLVSPTLDKTLLVLPRGRTVTVPAPAGSGTSVVNVRPLLEEDHDWLRDHHERRRQWWR